MVLVYVNLDFRVCILDLFSNGILAPDAISTTNYSKTTGRMASVEQEKIGASSWYDFPSLESAQGTMKVLPKSYTIMGCDGKCHMKNRHLKLLPRRLNSFHNPKINTSKRPGRIFIATRADLKNRFQITRHGYTCGSQKQIPDHKDIMLKLWLFMDTCVYYCNVSSTYLYTYCISLIARSLSIWLVLADTHPLHKN